MNKHNTRKRLIVAIAILSAILAVLVGVVIYLNLTEDELLPETVTTAPTTPEATDEETCSTESTESTETTETEVAVEGMEISTDFGTLYFPAHWKNQIRTESVESDNGGVVVFYGAVAGKEAELFVVVFSQKADGTGIPVGAINLDGETYLVSIKVGEKVQDESWGTEALNAIEEMRQDINYLIERMAELPNFSEDTSTVLPELENEDIEIVTPFATLCYPGLRQGQVWAEYTEVQDGGYVTFYGAIGGEDVTIFVVNFGPAGEDAAHIGYIQHGGTYVKVSIKMNHPEGADNWQEADINLLAAMQEGVNDLIQNLKQNSGFTTELITAPTEPTEGKEDVVVSTSYVDLVVPAQWENQIRTETEQVSGGYKVAFIGTVGDKEVVLFVFLFGVETEDSIPVGVLDVDGIAISVSIELMEIETETEDTWSGETLDLIASMQESLNDILEKLEENPNYSPN